jgi:hypothetical protein
VLDRYRLLERLGSGGFGVVWRARDELLQREVALKRIPLAPEEDSERSTREALATARLAHPAIVALYEACASGDAFYLISELVEGETLAQLMATRTLADEDVLEIGAALAGALSHAHARGVIHRDVKPQNVLVPHGRKARTAAQGPPATVAKLTDFGGASLAGEDALTREGDVLGTLAYMAPEQSEGREVGGEADLYALALVLYEALSGVNPVRGATPAVTARRIGRAIAPLGRLRGDLPRALTGALDTALTPSPADRGTLDQLRLALEAALERGRPRSSAARPRLERVGSDPRRRPPLREDGQLHELSEPRPRRAPVDDPLDADDAPGDEPLAARARPARAAGPLPRLLWSAGALAAITWQLWVGHPGAALLVLAAVLPLAALSSGQRSGGAGPGWLACALAPALGLTGLAGAFPALAGQASQWRRRASLGALGYWWLTLAEPLLARRLWLGSPPGTPARAVWETSLSAATLHVLAPLLSLGVLLGALLWAAGALVLPWIVRGASAVIDALGAAAWSAGLLLATPAFDAGLSAHGTHPSPRGAILAAILAAAVALAARALRGPV